MPELIAGPDISVPQKKDSEKAGENNSPIHPNKAVAPNGSLTGNDESVDLDKGAIESSSQNVKAEGGKNSTDSSGDRYETYLDNRGKAIAVFRDRGNPYCVSIRSKAFEHRLRRDAQKRDIKLRKSDLYEIVEEIEANAEVEGEIISTFYRVAPIPGGIEIDAGCDDQIRYRITAGSVEIISHGSDAIFSRVSTTLPLPAPADEGDLTVLDKYLNLEETDKALFLGLISYVIAHPKVPATNYPIIGLIGSQGTGKSVLSKLVQDLVDPNVVGIQSMPSNAKDFSIALQNTHILCIDNIRSIKDAKSDLCCIASTGGTISSRALYTNEEQHVIHLHGALLLNGIHDFIDQSDMAERSVILHPLPISPRQRKSEAELKAALDRDMPIILRGFYDLISKIFEQKQNVKATNPERLIELSDWFACMEKVDGVEEQKYQLIYSANLRQAQLNSLLENALAVSVIQFAEALKRPWEGTPSDLLDELNQEVSRVTQRSPNWPQNSIALSKRLMVLQAGLKSQGIYVTTGRKKERKIYVTTDKIEAEY